MYYIFICMLYKYIHTYIGYGSKSMECPSEHPNILQLWMSIPHEYGKIYFDPSQFQHPKLLVIFEKGKPMVKRVPPFQQTRTCFFISKKKTNKTQAKVLHLIQKQIDPCLKWTGHIGLVEKGYQLRARNLKVTG